MNFTFIILDGGSSSSNRLPSIPHTETPSWQKPITNFFYNKKDSIKINDDQTDSLEKESMENKGEKSVQDDKTLTYEKINQSQTENTSTE